MFIYERLGKVSGGELIVTRLRNVINAVENQIIIGYENNRGYAGVSKSRVKELGENFKAESWGTPVISKFDGKYVLVDGHTRMAALMHAFEEGLLPEDALRKTISFQICKPEDFLPRYTDLNNNKAHNGKAVLTNPDLPLGELLHELVDDYSVINKFNQPLARLAFLISSQPNIEWNDKTGEVFRSVLDSGYEISKITKSESLKDKIFLNSDQKEFLKNGIGYVLEVRDEIESKLPSVDSLRKAPVKKLLNNPGLFTAFVVAALAESNINQPIFRGRSAENVAERFIGRVEKLVEPCQDLGRNPIKAKEKFVEISKALFRRR